MGHCWGGRLSWPAACGDAAYQACIVFYGGRIKISLIDGATPLGALWRVTMPLAMPGMAAIFLLTFVNVWNEVIAGYLLISKNELKTVMFGLYDFLGANIINLQVIAAACILLALPMILVFLVFRSMVDAQSVG